jgi:hypothetical protein
MILFLADGRLGNQLFQYAFVKTIQTNNETIIVSGFEDLKEVFEVNDFIVWNKKNKWRRRFLFRIVKPVLYLLSSAYIISSIHVNYEKVLDKYRRESTDYTRRTGLFRSFIYIKPGFFQSEKFFNARIIENLKIKRKYISQADLFLSNIPENSHLVFLHIRRGDYKNQKIYGKDCLLPVGYFKEQIEYFLQNRQNCFFIFLSDDPDFIEKEFDYIENKQISTKAHFGTDLTIMSKCKSAILSPSSFGWWGAYLMSERDIICVPKYWMGFKSGVEYHTNANPSFAKEVTIC